MKETHTFTGRSVFPNGVSACVDPAFFLVKMVGRKIFLVYTCICVCVCVCAYVCIWQFTSHKNIEQVQPFGQLDPLQNGVYSLKWWLTDRYLRWGDTRTPAAGPGRGRSVQIEWISAWTAHLGFPALLSVPHLLSREIMMNRRHSGQLGLQLTTSKHPQVTLKHKETGSRV